MDRTEERHIITLLQGILLLLEQISSLQEELLSLEQEKKEVLIHGKIQRLSEIVQIENQKVTLLGKLEREREKAAKELASLWGLKEEPLTMQEILRRTTDPLLVERFRRLQSTLLEQNDQLRRQNEINALLIQESLEYVKMNMELLAEQVDSRIYTNPISEDKEKPTASRNLFDTRI